MQQEPQGSLSCSSEPSSSQKSQSAAHLGVELSHASEDQQTEQSKTHSLPDPKRFLGLDLPNIRPTGTILKRCPDRRVPSDPRARASAELHGGDPGMMQQISRNLLDISPSSVVVIVFEKDLLETCGHRDRSTPV